MVKHTMPPLIKKYYKSWINGPTLFDHPNDRERFYRFSKACLRYGRIQRNGHWLRHFLKKDLSEKYDLEDREFLIQEAVSLFDHLMDFYRVNFPDFGLEKRNPYMVGEDLRRIQKVDGTLRYSEKEIHNILNKDFGVGWDKKRKMYYEKGEQP